MTIIRRLIGNATLSMAHVREFERQIEREGCTMTAAGALHPQSAAHFPRCQRAAVQSETMTVFLRGKPMIEDLSQVLRLNADSIVADGNPHAVGPIRDAHYHLLVLPVRRFAGIFSIAQEIYKNLQHFVFFDDDFRYVFKFALQADAMPRKRPDI